MAELSVPAGVDPTDPAYVENPATTERFRFHSPPDDRSTDPLVFDLWAERSRTPIGTHLHPRQDETLRVEEGYLVLHRAGDEVRLEPGDVVTIEAGTPHTWRPTGDHEVHLTVRLEPGLRTEAFLRDLAALGRAGRLGADGVPSVLQTAALLDAYGFDLLRPASPPLAVQRVVFGGLAPLARSLGYVADPVGPRRG